ncbi:3-isopropylmalate dehydratase [Pseudomonas matsuisoli]|uniref:3-isopropylmalate dehydratase n=1 Tax=Pseudomonas matsuisoli TaxID=1515666 RepID=A0A917PHP2_9PSED|nr:3-isopropylmalate dehydratase [Pseudomonas matsuisoli]GGJ78501.1 hypothetical protein GCM10009304_00500 [Pseudomonas matsuisoli]
MRPIFAALPLAILAGCSSYQVDEITPVPSERLMTHQEPAGERGEVRINRDVGYLGGGCFVEFLIDRQVAARIGRGESASFYVEPGQHIVGIGRDHAGEGLCAKARLKREKLVTVEPGQRYVFRIVSEASSGFDIRPDDSKAP